MVLYLGYTTCRLTKHGKTMQTRRYVITAGLGSAFAAGTFFVLLDRALSSEQWGQVTVTAVTFGLFMAVWNGILIRIDSKQRTTRNIVFEHAVAEFTAVMGTAWALAPSIGHLRWRDLALYTVVALPLILLVRLLTRKNIKGEDPGGLFA